jgi:hypothetical protein
MRRRPTILDFFPADEIDPRTWTFREHSRWRRQWRIVRRLPIIVQVIIALFALWWFTAVFFATWLVVGAATMPHP